MNIPLMTMPKSVAREAFLTYKRALDRRAGTKGDELAMECYRQMSRGRTLLELNTVDGRACSSSSSIGGR